MRASQRVDPAEAAYRRFLGQQKEGLRAWAKKRAAQLDEVGMSAEMEVLVCDLLEELREEPAALAASSVVHGGTEQLLMRACTELKFLERHARQAIAIVLAREGSGVEGGGGVSLLQRPGLLSDCLDWLCVHVPLDELPLQFRPKLRIRRAVKLPPPPDDLTACGPRTNNTGVWTHASNGAAHVARPVRTSWACATCTLDNPLANEACEACGSARPPPPPPTADELREAEAAAVAEATAAVEEGVLARLSSFGFVRARCRAALRACGGVEEQALASLIRDRLLADAGVRGTADEATPLTDALFVQAGGEEAEELRLISEEEEEALEAILDSEFERAPNGCLRLTLIWDASTGEAPWAFTAAHVAPASDAMDGEGRRDARGQAAATPARCVRCVIPGCGLPTNRHRASAYCNAAHAEHDAGQSPPHHLAFVAGFRPDGSALSAAERGLSHLLSTPEAHSLRSLQLLVCSRAAVPEWPYPRAPPLVAVQAAGGDAELLPRTRLELTRVLLRRGLELARENATAPAPQLYELLCWFRAELPALLQRLACVRPPSVTADEPQAAAEEEGAGETSGPAAPLTAAQRAEMAKYALQQRTRLELDAAREAEERDRLERWEKVKALIRREEADAAAAKAATRSAQARGPSPASRPPSTAQPMAAGAESASPVAPAGRGGGGRTVGRGRGRVGRGRGDVLWPEPPPTAMDAQLSDARPAVAGVSTDGEAAGRADALPFTSSPMPPGLTSPVAIAGASPADALTTARSSEEAAPRAAQYYLPARPSLAPHPLSEVQQRESETMRAAHAAAQHRPKQRQMAEARARLPAATKREGVLRALESSSVLVVSGETGCGKTTQVPQFLLDDAIDHGRGGAVSIICTQPRRISAIGVATRVAAERGEPLGQTVGYQIRLESVRSHRTRLLFCTTGVLLRRLHSDHDLDGVSHVVVDEVHERSLQSDFLLIILREVLRRRPTLRVVLMSATINAELFANYFATAAAAPMRALGSEGAAAEGGTPHPDEAGAIVPAPTLHIPGFTHPVTEYWLEDVLEMTGHLIEPGSAYANR